MRNTLKRLTVSAAAVALLTGGAVAGSNSLALAASSEYPCGLTYRIADAPYGPLKVVYYHIRNCHGFTVKRKLDLAGTTDDECLTIPPGQTVSRTRIAAGWAEVNGMKAC